jgi:hypothetical protein
MKPHRHAEIIKEFVNGKECEYHIPYADKWEEINFLADFDTRHTVRIKPEPKPDVVDYLFVGDKELIHFTEINWVFENTANLKLVWDGETKQLKSAEVIK